MSVTFEQLPLDVVGLIFNELDILTRVKLSAISKEIYNLVRTEFFPPEEAAVWMELMETGYSASDVAEYYVRHETAFGYHEEKSLSVIDQFNLKGESMGDSIYFYLTNDFSLLKAVRRCIRIHLDSGRKSSYIGLFQSLTRSWVNGIYNVCATVRLSQPEALSICCAILRLSQNLHGEGRKHHHMTLKQFLVANRDACHDKEFREQLLTEIYESIRRVPLPGWRERNDDQVQSVVNKKQKCGVCVIM